MNACTKWIVADWLHSALTYVQYIHTVDATVSHGESWGCSEATSWVVECLNFHDFVCDTWLFARCDCDVWMISLRFPSTSRPIDSALRMLWRRVNRQSFKQPDMLERLRVAKCVCVKSSSRLTFFHIASLSRVRIVKWHRSCVDPKHTKSIQDFPRNPFHFVTKERLRQLVRRIDFHRSHVLRTSPRYRLATVMY